MSSQIQTQSDAVDSDCLLLFSFHNLQIDFRGFLVECHKTKTKNTFFLLTFAAGINRAVIQSETQGNVMCFSFLLGGMVLCNLASWVARELVVYQ